MGTRLFREWLTPSEEAAASERLATLVRWGLLGFVLLVNNVPLLTPYPGEIISWINYIALGLVGANLLLSIFLFIWPKRIFSALTGFVLQLLDVAILSAFVGLPVLLGPLSSDFVRIIPVYIRYTPYYILYFLIILAAALRFGLWASLLFSLMISGIYTWIVLPQSYAFPAGVGNTVLTARVLAFVGVGALAGVLAWQTRRQRRERELARRRAGELEVVQRVANAISTTLELDALMERVFLALQETIPFTEGEITLWEGAQGRLIGRSLFTREGYIRRQVSYAPGEGYSGWMVVHREPLWIPDVLAEERVQPKDRAAFASYLGVPLLLGERLVGTLELSAAEKEAFTREQVETLTAAAPQIAAMLDHARLYDQVRRRLERRVQQLNAIEQIDRELAGTLDLQQVIQEVLDHAVEFTEADAGALLVMSDQRDELSVLASRGYQEDLVGSQGRQPWPLSEGITGRVARTNEPALVEDVSRAPDYAQASEQTRSELAVPISREDEVLGVLNLESHRQAGFDEEDLEFAEHLAEHAAIAMYNAQLFAREQRRARELAALQEISLDISSELSLDRLLEALVQRTLDLLGREAGSVWLYDEDVDLLRCVASVAEWRDFTGATLAPGEGLNGQVFVQGEPIVIDDYQTWAGAMYENEPFGPAVSVPLMWRGQVRGAINVVDPPGRPPFSEDEVTALSLLAAQGTIAIQNAQLFEETRRWADQMALLQEVNRTMVATLEFRETLESLIQGLDRLIPHTGGEVCLYDPDLQVLVSQGLHGESARVVSAERYAIGEGYTGWLAQHRQPLLIEDAVNFTEARPKRDEVLESGQLRSFLGAPMLIGDRLVGTLELISDRLGAFDQADLRLLTMVANQAAVAIDNARLYEFTERSLHWRVEQLVALQQLGQEMNTTLLLEHNLQVLVEGAVRATPATHGNVAMYDPSVRAFRVTSALVGYTPEEIRLLKQLRLGRGRSLVDDVVRSGQAEIVADAQSDPRPVCVREGTRAALSVPILYEGRVIGVVNLFSTEEQAFGEGDLQFTQTLATQASLAVGNARRYEELVQQRELVGQRATQLREILEIGNTLRADRELSDILDQVAYGVVGSVGFGLVLFGMVSEEDADRLEWVTSAGVPLDDFQRMQQVRPSLESYRGLFRQEFQVSRSYFIPQESGLAIEDEHIYLFPGMAYDEEIPEEEWHPRDLLMVPMYASAGDLLGVMSVGNPFDRSRPSRRTVEALEIFANQAAIAVENARLFRERERRIAELNVLNRISQATTSTLDLDHILRSIYERLAEARVLDVESFYIAIYDRERQRLRFYPVVDRGVLYDAQEGSAAEGMAGWVVQQRRPLLIEDIAEAEAAGTVDYISLAGWEGERTRSYLGVPMVLGEDLIGVIAAQSYQQAAYSERDKQFLLTVANQVAVAIQNARLFREREQRLAELAILNEISQVLSSALELDELAETVHQQVSRVFDTTNFYIALYDEDVDEWWTLLEIDQGGRVPPERYEVGAGLTGYIIRHKAPLLFQTEGELEAFHRAEGIDAIGQQALSWLGVPLIAADQVVGVMAVQSYEQGNLYTEQDLALFSTIAAQAAITIDNARLFEERERRIAELAILNEIGRALSSALELDELAEAVYQQVSRIFDTTNFYIAAYYEEADEWGMVLHRERGERQEPVRRRVQAGLTGQIIRNRQPILLRNGEEIVAFHEERGIDMIGEQARSWLGVPLIAADQVVGVMAIQSYEQEDLYDADDLALFSTIAAQAAVAMDNARLFEERERRITELAIVNEIGRALSATLDPDQVTRVVHQQVGRIFDTTNFYIALYDPEGREWETVLDIYQGTPQPAARYGVEEGLTGYIIRHRQPLLFHTEADLQRFNEEHEIDVIGEQALSWVGVPMIAADQVIGVIGVESYDREYLFGEDDQAVLSTVAAQAAVAMQNARLFEETRRRLQQVNTLLEVSRDVATRLDLPTLLQSIMDAAVASVPAAERGSILLLDAEAQELVRAAQIGYASPATEGEEVRLGLDEGFAGWVCREERADIVADAHADPRFVVTETTQDVRTLMSAPLIGRRGLVGVINLDNRTRVGAFRQRDLEFLSGLAHQAAVAIENASLFEERERQAQVLQSRVRELSALLEGTRAISSTLELKEVLDTLVGVVSRQMEVATVALWLVEGDELTPAAAQGLPEEFMRDVRVQVGEGLSGHVAGQGEVLAIADVAAAAQDRRSPAYAAYDEQLGLHAYLGVPITYQERVLGVLSVMAREAREFAQEEVALLTGLAEQAGIAVENARLFSEREQRIAELVALNEVGRAISSTMRLDELLETVRREAGRLIDTSNFMVALYDERRDVVSFPVYHELGRPVESPDRQGGNGLTEYVIRQQAPVLIDGDTEAFCRERGIDHIGTGAKSWLGVPMIYMDRVVGVIALQDYEHAGAYDEHHVRLLSTIATTAAVAIQNARFFSDLEASRTELETRLIQLGALQEMGQTISGTLELDAVLDTVLETVTATVGFSYTVISLVDEEDEEVRAVQGLGVSEEQIAISRHPLDSADIMADIVRTGRTEVIDGWDERFDREIFETFGHADLVRVFAPLMARGKVIGLIEAGYPKDVRSAITPDDVEVLQTFLAQASIAIDNARLFAEIRRFTEELEQMVEARTEQLQDEKNRLEALHAITTELTSTLDLDEIILKTMELASWATGRSQGMVLLRDISSGDLICRAMIDEDYVLRPGQLEIPAANLGAFRRVLEQQEVVHIEDVANDPRIEELPPLPSGTRDVVIVPLVSAETVVGAILLSQFQAGFFNEDQMRLMMTLAGEVATAIHNAELYSYINDQATRLSEMLIHQQEESSKVRAILESIGDGVIVIDREDRIILANPAVEDILEIPREELEGSLTQNLPGLFKEGGIFAQESRRIELMDRYINVHSAPVIMDTGVVLGSVYVLRDITREVEADRAKSEFISTVSHELRTPLTSIKGYVDLILLGSVGEVTSMQKNFLDVVRANANRLVDLINDLLDISRIETGRIALNPEPISIFDLVEEVLAAARMEMEKKSLHLEMDVPQDLPLVNADRKRVLQVLNNLVSNAYKYTEQGGLVKINAQRIDSYIQVDVSDTGVGISPADQEKLFTRFFRADNPLSDEVGGTGLGLAISKSFVEMHGGEMWVESELDVGSTFSFTLPLDYAGPAVQDGEGEVEEEPREEPVEREPVEALGPYTILVVDDEPNITALLRYQLERAGYEVRTARRGEDALEVARQEPLDLITLDIMMAGMDGFEVLERLKADEQTRDIPVVIVSIIAEQEDLMAMGAVDFLPKPLDEAALRSTIRKVLHSTQEGRRVLIVDDDPDILGWLGEVLEREGFQVREARDGETALEAVFDFWPELILLDLRLPGLDGREVIERLKLDQQTCDIPIIVITASSVDKERDRVQVLGMGAESFLTKPFTAEVLVQEIELALKERMEAAKE